jgi:hypothetical protein
MIIVKILTLKLFWYLTILYGDTSQLLITVISALLVFLNFTIYKPKVSKGHYVFMILLFLTYGFIQEKVLETLDLVQYQSS